MERTASAAWSGGLRTGTGTISTESGVLSNTRYGYRARFENTSGTNPEELIAAAHAGSYSMALVTQLEEAGFKAESIRTRAAVTLEIEPGGLSITAIHLDTVAQVPGASQGTFDVVAAKAQARCPVSKLLKARITYATRLES